MWENISETLSALITRLLDWTQASLITYAPKVLLALLTLVLGWLLASFIRQLTAKGLKAIGFDVVCERAGLRALLEKRQITNRPSVMIAWGLYAVILYTALVIAVERLEIQAAVRLFEGISTLLPKLLAVAVLVIVGWIIAGWVARLVCNAAKIAGVPFFNLLAGLSRIGVIAFTLILAIDYLGLASREVLFGLLVALMILVISIGFITVICAREQVGNLLALSFVTAEYGTGDKIRIGDIEGEVESIGLTVVRIKNEDRTAIVPNRLFAENTVYLLDKALPKNKRLS